MTGRVAAAYDRLVAAGELRPDPAQARAVAALDRLAETADNRRGLLGRIFGKRPPGCGGVYLWGGVGRGKSMLMDLAFDHIDIAHKRRVHFHAFMLETHGRLRDARASQEGDPIEEVAEIIASAGLLTTISSNASSWASDAIRTATSSIGSPSSLWRASRNRAWVSSMKAWKWTRRLGAMSI